MDDARAARERAAYNVRARQACEASVRLVETFAVRQAERVAAGSPSEKILRRAAERLRVSGLLLADHDGTPSSG